MLLPHCPRLRSCGAARPRSRLLAILHGDIGASGTRTPLGAGGRAAPDSWLRLSGGGSRRPLQAVAQAQDGQRRQLAQALRQLLQATAPLQV